MKDLPKVFANPIEKDIKNNRSFTYGKLEEESNERNEKEVLRKIDAIFKREGNVYSIDCLITFENNVGKYTIIGKTSHNLVTRTEKLIPIREIYDIELA